ncbi:hypothetical protein UFOVP244_102 [uncultured Caudovirales phage]|uniref:Uncharacterized protein n=1 Tax=uncultured Caudovirales phage TaxID=2100421 RepID=A0A6J7WTV2_9CAUD|nr:hypothetical protein UFOVP244_102 [uncultured Caudovirales phage]
MKFKCVNNEIEKLFGKVEKINGLTIGKIYSGSVSSNGHYDPTIIIYDDNKKWAKFWGSQVNFFEPVET